MSQVLSEFAPNEAVQYLYKRGGKLYPTEAVVLKINKKLVRIKAKLNGKVWEFISVRPDELRKVGYK